MTQNDDVKAASPEPSPIRWSFAQCVGFRFACVYLVLYSFPFPIGLIPKTEPLSDAYDKLWIALVTWIGRQVLHLPREISVAPTGSGDTTFEYVRLACIGILATTGTLLWTLLQRRRRYERLSHWLRVYVRYVLATSLLSYGMMKVFKSQFPAPSALRLIEPYGDSSPMALLWTFMGFSTPYTMFVGAAEAVAGALLLFRRTTTLGALVAIAVMTNVVMLNFCYDVPVKLYSLHLWLMGVFLLLPDARRLANFFLLHRPTQPVTSPRAARVRGVAKILFAGLIVFLTTKGGYESWTKYGDRAIRGPLEGAYEVEEFVIDRKVIPPWTTESHRWRKVGISTYGRVLVRRMDDSMERYRLEMDPKKKTVVLSTDTSETKSTLAYDWPDSAHLRLSGVLLGDTLSVRMRKIARSEFPLLARGFHWVSEFPYNK